MWIKEKGREKYLKENFHKEKELVCTCTCVCARMHTKSVVWEGAYSTAKL